MGLDTTHECWHGPYSMFGIWRAKVARAAERPVEPSPYGDGEHHIITEKYPARCYQGWWDDDPADVLDVLLVHSDCDGYIFPQHTEGLANRLEGLLLKIDSDWRDVTIAFIQGLREAAEGDEIVGFH